MPSPLEEQEEEEEEEQEKEGQYLRQPIASRQHRCNYALVSYRQSRIETQKEGADDRTASLLLVEPLGCRLAHGQHACTFYVPSAWFGSSDFRFARIN